MLDLYRFVSTGQTLTPLQVTTLLGWSLGGIAQLPGSEADNEVRKFWLLSNQDGILKGLAVFNELYPINIDQVLEIAYTIYVRRYYALYNWPLSDGYSVEKYNDWRAALALDTAEGQDIAGRGYRIIKELWAPTEANPDQVVAAANTGF